MANDLITTDFTSDMVQSVVFSCLDAKVAAEAEVEETEEAHATEPAFSFLKK